MSHRAIMIILAAAFAAGPVPASAFDMTEDPPKVKRHKGTRVKAYVKRVDEKEKDKARCLDVQRGVGTQWITMDGAEDAARKDWMETVRYDFGEKFMSIDNARDYEHRCSRSSVGSAAAQMLFRCEVRARPCIAPAAEINPTAEAKK
jgi:hypothetical protein